MFTLNEGATSWKSSKQPTTIDLTKDFEYITASDVAMEVVWLKKFITNVGIVPTMLDPIK